MHDFINFYCRKSDNAIQRVIHATHHVTMDGLTIEVNVLVHLLEFLGREIIVQHRTCNRGKYGVFDGLVVPQSWALDIAKRPPLIVQTGFGFPELMEYLSTLYKTLENLREYGLKASCLYSFSGKAVLNLHPLPENYAGRALISYEIELGQKILFAYRQHIWQRQQSAEKTIWRCYSRYLRRRNNLFVADNCYIKFQREYEKDIKTHETPGSHSRSVNQRKSILLSQFTRKLRRLMSAIMPGSAQLQDPGTLQARVKEITNVYAKMEEAFGTDVMPVSLEQHYHRGIAIILAQQC
ncbi:hypothetical protein B0J17DRAFT_706405 [Rhizoctonia solani]|nr:hypothetical protein B0J17DRAFT_706405 [Rhizoctonia solani]